VLDLVARGVLQTQPLITNSFSFDPINAAFGAA
jgi:hypothetical protein